MRGATLKLHQELEAAGYFNPRPPCGGRHGVALKALDMLEFQSTPPVRGATDPDYNVRTAAIFQSTPPVRGATSFSRRPSNPHQNFNPRPPCGGRPQGLCDGFYAMQFQSTPPVRGATIKSFSELMQLNLFQSTPPVRGATAKGMLPEPCVGISIHAPRAGGDVSVPEYPSLV